MSPPPCVVIYGNSVFLAGIRADLKGRTWLQLVTVEPGSPDALRRIRELNPAVVLVDLAAAQPDVAISVLRDRPEIILIGVDPSSDKMLVLYSRQEQPLSAADLVQMITGK